MGRTSAALAASALALPSTNHRQTEARPRAWTTTLHLDHDASIWTTTLGLAMRTLRENGLGVAGTWSAQKSESRVG